jgi:hypothetical protein
MKNNPTATERVMVGMYHPDGGTSGEFEVEWIVLQQQKCAKLKSFEDSWSALWLFKDLIEKMSEIDSDKIQEPEFCKLLDSLGIIDITAYEESVSKYSLLDSAGNKDISPDNGSNKFKSRVKNISMNHYSGVKVREAWPIEMSVKFRPKGWCGRECLTGKIVGHLYVNVLIIDSGNTTWAVSTFRCSAV